MNILLSSLNYKPEIGGIENSLFYIAKNFRAMGHQVKILTGDKSSITNDRLLKIETVDAIKVYRFKRLNTKYSFLKIFQNIYDIISCFFFLKKFFAKNDFDLIISRNYISGINSFLYFKNAKKIYIPPAIPFILDHRRISEFDGYLLIRIIKYFIYNYLTLSEIRFYEKILSKKADQIFVFSIIMKNQFQKYIKLQNKQIDILKPGVDGSIFARAIKNNNNSIFPSNKFKFLIISRLIKLKGIDYAIKSFIKLKNNNIILYIVGDGPEQDFLKDIVKKNNAEHKIVFFNSTQNPEKYFNNVDAFVLPSVYESFGQTILEALAASLPIIAFDSNQKNISTATSEIIDNESNGVLCEYSIRDLTNGYKKILSSKNLDSIRIRNRAKAIENYSWKRFCIKLLEHGKKIT